MESSFLESIPKPTPFFTGRTQELKQLAELFYNNPGKNPIVITGLGGNGKTELTTKFISTLDPNNFNILWLSSRYLKDIKNTETASAADKLQLLYQEISTLNNTNQTQDIQTVFVIDGVSYSMKFVLVTFIEKLVHANTSIIIITTIIPDLFPMNVTLIPLREWNAAEAETYVNLALRSKQRVDDIRQLNSHLPGHPLVMYQAMCYILSERCVSLQGGSYGIPHFLKKFHTNGVSLMADKLPYDRYKKTVLTTFDEALFNVKTNYSQTGTLAYGILQVLALLTNITEVNLEGIQFLVSTAFPNLKYNLDAKGVSDGVQLLKLYFLVEADSEIVRIHPLVGAVVGYKIKTELLTTNDKVNGISKSVEEQLRHNFILHLYFDQISLNNYKYVLKIWDGCTSNENLIKKFSNVPDLIFYKLVELSLFDVAVNFAKSSVDLFTKVFGKCHNETVNMQNNLVVTLLQIKNEYRIIKC